MAHHLLRRQSALCFLGATACAGPLPPPFFALHKPRLSLASEITSSKGPTAETEVGSAVIHVFLPSLCLYFPFEAILWRMMCIWYPCGCAFSPGKVCGWWQGESGRWIPCGPYTSSDIFWHANLRDRSEYIEYKPTNRCKSQDLNYHELWNTQIWYIYIYLMFILYAYWSYIDHILTKYWPYCQSQDSDSQITSRRPGHGAEGQHAGAAG